MRKLLLFIGLGLLGFTPAVSQIFLTQTGQTSFFSETMVENISAENAHVGAILNEATGEIAVRMQMFQFRFPNRLMEDHFNENYMESEKYPVGTFRGKIQEKVDFSQEGTRDVTAKGVLELHGVRQERILKGKLTVGKQQLTLVCDFDVRLADHKIEIPTLVMTKVAEVVSVKNRFVLQPKKAL